MSTDSLILTGLVFSPHTSLPVVQDRTKSFFIAKLITVANNTTAHIYTKSIIWISGIPFPILNDAWQYMLGIPNNLQQLKITEDIAYQQVLSMKKMSYKYKDMARLLKQDGKSLGIAK